MTSATIPPFAALRAFEAIGRLGGIRRAAEELSVNHAIVSRHLSGLEDYLGVQMIDRRSGRLTDAGQRYHQSVAGALTLLISATKAVNLRNRETLEVWCSAGLALHWLTRRLSRFECGGINLRSTEARPELSRGDADADIRYLADGQNVAESEMRSLELFRPVVFPVASPEFASGLPVIRSAADVLALPLIAEEDDREWRSWFRHQDVEGVGELRLAARLGQAHLTLAVARSGLGVALSNRLLASEDLAEGRLVAIEGTERPFAPACLGAYTFYATRQRWHDPQIVRLRNWLKTEIETTL